MQRVCVPGMAVYNVTLSTGLGAGTYNRLGQVSNVQECIDKICEKGEGDIAYLLNKACYSIKCFDVDSCETAAMPFAQDLQSVLVYMTWKGAYNCPIA